MNQLTKLMQSPFQGGSVSANPGTPLAYLLPAIPLVQEGRTVKELSTVIHEAQCTTSIDKGVLYIHIHSAANLTTQDSMTSDPYVYIYLNNERVSSTPTIRADLSPVWDHKLEILLNSGKK